MVFALAFGVKHAHCAPVIWTGGSSSSNNWSADSNWSTGAAPGATADVEFYQNGAARLATNTVASANNSINSLTYSATSTIAVVTGGTNTLTIGNGGITVASGAAGHSISAPISFGGNQASITVTVDNTAGYTASGNISVTSAARSIEKAGSGTFTFSGADISLRGGVTVSGGILVLTGGTSNGYFLPSSGNSNVSVSSGTKIDMQGANGEINGTLTGAGEFTNSGGTTRTLTISRGSGYTLDTTLTGKLALAKTGNANITLSAANTFTGDTKVTAGILNLTNALALQNSAIDTSGAGVITLTSVTTPTFGGLKGSTNLASVITTGYSTVTGITLNPGTGVTDTYSGIIANGASNMTLTKTGAGTQTLSGANGYTGTTKITGGTLALEASERIGNSSALDLNGGKLETGGFSETLGTLTLSDNSQLDLGSGTSLLTFTSLASYTSGKTLTIFGWTGSVAGGGTDRIRFTSDVTNQSFLDNVTFDGLGNGAATVLNGGFYELIPIPEPATFLAGGVILGLASLGRRRVG